MNIKSFIYTKKKDEQTKNYVVLVLDPPKDKLHLIGGIELSKLEDKEVKELLFLQNEYEIRIKDLQTKALKENLDFDHLISTDEYIDIQEAYKEKMHPYIKKAYRVFIKENIEATYNFDMVECLINRVILAKNDVK